MTNTHERYIYILILDKWTYMNVLDISKFYLTKIMVSIIIIIKIFKLAVTTELLWNYKV